MGPPAGGTWRVRVDSDDPRWSPDFHGTSPATVEAIAHPYDNQGFTGPITLGPWSAVVLSRDLILTKVWGDDYFVDKRTVDVHIRWLREKIEDDPSNPRRIVTVRGVGYRFEG